MMMSRIVLPLQSALGQGTGKDLAGDAGNNAVPRMEAANRSDVVKPQPERAEFHRTELLTHVYKKLIVVRAT